MNNSGQKEGKIEVLSLMRHSVLGAFVGLIVTMLAMLLFSTAMVSKLLPVSMQDSFILLSVIIGTTLGGIYCAKKEERGVITAGLCAAAVYILMVLLGTLMFMKKGDDPSLTLKIIIAAVAGGCFGGTLRLGRRTKKSKLRKKYYKQ